MWRSIFPKPRRRCKSRIHRHWCWIRRAQLEDAVRGALAENGVACTDTDVTLETGSGAVEVAGVTVTVPAGTDAAYVEDVVVKALGTQAPITVNEEG